MITGSNQILMELQFIFSGKIKNGSSEQLKVASCHFYYLVEQAPTLRESLHQPPWCLKEGIPPKKGGER